MPFGSTNGWNRCSLISDGAAALVLIDPSSLTVSKRSSQAVYPATYIHTQSGAIYAVAATDGAYRVGKFGESLDLEAESAAEVDPSTYITIFGSEVYCSSPEGNILVLSAEDLSTIGEVSP